MNNWWVFISVASAVVAFLAFMVASGNYYAVVAFLIAMVVAAGA